MSTNLAPQSEPRRDRLILDAATTVFTVLIALLGAVMMTVTSSPLVKGASFLWLPAALQLIAGVWLGPVRGFIAGGVGAQAAGIIAYGGWAPADWIMNFVAGGFANSLLPGVLFKFIRIDASLGSKEDSFWRASVNLLVIVVLVLVLAILQLIFAKHVPLSSAWGFVLPLVFVLAVPLFWRSMALDVRNFLLALIVAVVSCLVSAMIGVVGAVVGGQSWEAAFFATGIGWFLGDTASAILGIYMLAQFTQRARYAGFAVRTA